MSLSLQRFSELVEAYGGDASRWPGRERAAARALLADSAEARALIEREIVVERGLQLPEPPPPPAALRARILQAAPSRPAAKSRGFWRDLLDEFGGWRPVLVPAAAALVLGLGLGLGLALQALPQDDELLALLQIDVSEGDYVP